MHRHAYAHDTHSQINWLNNTQLWPTVRRHITQWNKKAWTQNVQAWCYQVWYTDWKRVFLYQKNFFKSSVLSKYEIKKHCHEHIKIKTTFLAELVTDINRKSRIVLSREQVMYWPGLSIHAAVTFLPFTVKLMTSVKLFFLQIG